MAEVEEVQKHLSQLNAQPEKTAQLSFLKGIDHLLLQDLGAAISALTEAIERDPSFTLAYYARSIASLRRSEAERGRPVEQSTPSTPQVRAAATGAKATAPAELPPPSICPSESRRILPLD